jgi:hypothetical protein
MTTTSYKIEQDFILYKRFESIVIFQKGEVNRMTRSCDFTKLRLFHMGLPDFNANNHSNLGRFMWRTHWILNHSDP